MPMRPWRPISICLCVCAAASLAALALLIVTSPHGLRYDEKFHLVAARLADQIGLLEALQSPDNRSAAGPLFLALQLLAAPFTHLQVPAARLVNWVLLLVTIGLTYLQLRDSRAREPMLGATLLLAVPFMWPITGLAITELPALAAFALFLLLFQRSLDAPEESSGRVPFQRYWRESLWEPLYSDARIIW